MIRDFFRSGLTQRRGLCDRYLSYEDDERLKSLYSPDVTVDAALDGGEAEHQSGVKEGLDDDHPGGVETGRHYSCAGLTIGGVMASQRLGADRKETIAFGFKHIIRGKFVWVYV